MTNNPDTTRSLELLDNNTETGGCGCGSCGCGSTDTTKSETAIEETPIDTGQTTESFSVTGMTCGHCASSVTSELKALSGVADVQVHLVTDGTSSVTVTSQAPLSASQVAAALDAAGDYQLAWPQPSIRRPPEAPEQT